MTIGLAGSGAEEDPWLITTMSELITVLRDVSAMGFYRVANVIDDGVYRSLSTLTTSAGSTYSPKVIDFDGYAVRFFMTVTVGGSYCMAAYVHFINMRLHFRYVGNVASNNNIYIVLRGGLTNCAIYQSVVGNYVAYVVNTYLGWTVSGTAALIPREFKGVVIGEDGSPAGLVTRFLTISTEAAVSGVHVYATASASSVITRRSSPLTIEYLDAQSSGAFTAAGWLLENSYLSPAAAQEIELVVQTNVGVGVSRQVYSEVGGIRVYLGETDAVGAGSFIARVSKFRGFAVVASEDYGCDYLMEGRAVVADEWYLPPTDAGYAYQAQAGGVLGSLAGVTFGAADLTISGILFVYRPRYKTVVSDRLSYALGGPQQVVSLSPGAGGAPVLDGDPAYLDGVVEEIHPMLGTVRPLSNAEVLAFERRDNTFVLMGSALSNPYGEFRVETDVYAGGDVFAFAADFPGFIWQSVIELSIGDRVRPTVNNGYVYEVITAGNSGATEPEWWADAGDGTEGAIGSATAKARPYYQPVGHGPLKMTLVE